METEQAECIELCNKMIRGERSAVDTYNSAIDKFGDHPVMNELRRIRDEHQKSVVDLEANVRSMGGDPAMDSGYWGIFATLVQNTANLLGKESAVEALAQGEQKGLDDYRDATKSDFLMPSCRALFTTTLIPRIQNHLQVLDKIEDAVN